jgi:hypothetical protein
MIITIETNEIASVAGGDQCDCYCTNNPPNWVWVSNCCNNQCCSYDCRTRGYRYYEWIYSPYDAHKHNGTVTDTN